MTFQKATESKDRDFSKGHDFSKRNDPSKGHNFSKEGDSSKGCNFSKGDDSSKEHNSSKIEKVFEKPKSKKEESQPFRRSTRKRFEQNVTSRIDKRQLSLKKQFEETLIALTEKVLLPSKVWAIKGEPKATLSV
ncbi:hypothetical protein V6N13_019743 [Hibiscus sabdariffa]